MRISETAIKNDGDSFPDRKSKLVDTKPEQRFDISPLLQWNVRPVARLSGHRQLAKAVCVET
jgi:hypothetical protein